MEDKLKILVEAHRKEADNLCAPDFLWERIAADLDKREKAATAKKTRYIRLLSFTSVAVAAVILLLLIAGIFVPQRRNEPNNFRAQYPELQQAEAYFQPMIIAKVRRIEQIGDKTVIGALLQDLALLEQDYEMLAKDLRDNADNRQIIKAMIENYRSRLQLLERIVNEIEKKQIHGKVDAKL